MVLRDGSDGVEVFMLERHVRSEFAGGALVFPGGKVDAADRTLPGDRYDLADPDRARDRLGVPELTAAVGFLVAAAREAFEEAGVLLAHRDGQPVTATDLGHDSMQAARMAMNDRARSFDFAAWLAEEDLILDLDALGLWSWWVTPKGAPHRYDTRFFVARLPSGQAGALSHDEVETTASRWITPSGALAAHDRSDVNLVYPTRQNLRALDAYPDAEAVWRAARDGRTDTRRLEPTIVVVGDELRVQHPDGDDPEPF